MRFVLVLLGIVMTYIAVNSEVLWFTGIGGLLGLVVLWLGIFAVEHSHED